MKIRIFVTLTLSTAAIVAAGYIANRVEQYHYPVTEQLQNIQTVSFHLPYVPDPRSSGNDYPAVLANAPSYSVTDAYGMENRTCSSYVLWKVDETYGYTPDMNSDNWPQMAQKEGIPTGTTPEVGSVAYAAPNSLFGTHISLFELTTYTAGDTGHVMWVNRINSNGTIAVSEYNLGNDGNYHVTVMAPHNLIYIYFGEASQAK